jgi:hypothetical protein
MFQFQAVCNSTLNANSPALDKRFLRITHPFHPQSGQQLVYVGERYNRAGARVLLETANGHIYSVPRGWTDLVAPDPQQVLGENRVLFQVRDLVELERLVSDLSERRTKERSDAL